MEAAADAGADVIELGIPFSDPLADGPTIQRSSFAALQKGTTVDTVLDALQTFRARRDTPTVLFTYLNPVLRRGLGEFCHEAAEAGADGLLLTDLPVGCDPGLEEQVMDAGLDWIRLLAPTTPRERVPLVAEGGSGFLYYISRTGVTGARTEIRSELAAEVAELREAVTLRVRDLDAGAGADGSARGGWGGGRISADHAARVRWCRGRGSVPGIPTSGDGPREMLRQRRGFHTLIVRSYPLNKV
jgi:tryptophan synthase alpha chain